MADIFSLRERLALNSQARRSKRQLQGQHIRVLARIEAAERLRPAQDKAAALEAPGTRQSLRPKVGFWRRLLGASTPISPPATHPDNPVQASRPSASARDQLDRLDQLVTVDLPCLVEHRDRIAEAVESAIEAAPPAAPPETAAPRLGQATSLKSHVPAKNPNSRWGANRHD